MAKQANEKGLNHIEYDGYLMIRGRHSMPQIKKHLKRTEKYLTLIKDALAEEGIPMILIAYPYGIHVGPDQWDRGREYWGFERGKIYDDYYAFDLVEDYVRRNRIPYINLLPAFLKNKGKELFFDIDGHLTPDANRIAAETIVRNESLEATLQTLLPF